MESRPFLVEVDEEHIRRERERARELRQSQWWKRRRADGKCHYCGARVGAQALTMDHLVPIIRGGSSTRGNVVPACKDCNTAKKHALPHEWRTPSRRHPEIARIREAFGARSHQRQEIEASSRAAVAMVVAPGDDDLEVLLIKRAEHPHDPWSGHMALPGGRMDEGDAALHHTAIRETHEEVGIDLATHGELIAPLDELQAVGRGRVLNMIIAPFLFALDQRRDGPIDSNEVDRVVWVPLRVLQDQDFHGTTSISRDGLGLDFPALLYQGHTVWGLTYRILQSFLEVLKQPR